MFIDVDKLALILLGIPIIWFILNEWLIILVIISIPFIIIYFIGYFIVISPFLLFGYIARKLEKYDIKYKNQLDFIDRFMNDPIIFVFKKYQYFFLFLFIIAAGGTVFLITF